VSLVATQSRRNTNLCSKCDRQTPCSHCVSRKVPELCRAYNPGKPDQDVHSRLARVESVLEAALPQFWLQSDHNSARRSISPGVEDDAGITEGNDNMTGVFYRGSWFGSSAVGSIASPIVLEQVRSTPDASFIVLIGIRLTTSLTIGSPPSIPASRPMADHSPLLGNTLPRISSTHSFRIVVFRPTKLLSYYKNYPQRT